MTTEASDYAVQFDIRRDQSQNRITNFPLFIGTFIRYILLIPHLIILYFFGLVAYILYLIASFAILFTGSFPAGMYGLIENYLRWNARTNAYALHLFDKYPPFSGREDPENPLSLRVQRPERSSRVLNFPILGIILKFILLIPHFIVVSLLSIAVFVVVFIAQFAILFSGAFPEGMHSFCVGVSRWTIRLSAYVFGITDAYPPFSTR